MSPALFIVATGQDTCGWGIRIQQGFGRVAPEWSVRSTAATQRYMAYPTDLPFRKPLIYELYQAADVIQLRNTLHGWSLFDGGAGKPVVLLYHGTDYRAYHEELGAEARRVGAVQIVSTLDLALLEGDTTWVGSPYSPAHLRGVREEHYRPSERIRIAHAPTDRRIKGTEHFLAVVQRLQSRHPEVELELIEQQSWRRCLQRKARADIFYDQLELGYGNNAIEAWGMGLPVVAGVADPAVRAAMLARWGRLPFVEASTATLETVLERLVVSEAARREAGEMGAEHFARWHDEAVVVPQLAEIYRAAPTTEPGPRVLAEKLSLRAQRQAERAARRRHREEVLRARRARMAAGG